MKKTSTTISLSTVAYRISPWVLLLASVLANIVMIEQIRDTKLSSPLYDISYIDYQYHRETDEILISVSLRKAPGFVLQTQNDAYSIWYQYDPITGQETDHYAELGARAKAIPRDEFYLWTARFKTPDEWNLKQPGRGILQFEYLEVDTGRTIPFYWPEFQIPAFDVPDARDP